MFYDQTGLERGPGCHPQEFGCSGHSLPATHVPSLYCVCGSCLSLAGLRAAGQLCSSWGWLGFAWRKEMVTESPASRRYGHLRLMASALTGGGVGQSWSPGWPGRACRTQGFLPLSTLTTRPPCPHSEGAICDWLDLFPIGDKSQHCPRMLLSFII